jgi:hypothetical protein
MSQIDDDVRKMFNVGIAALSCFTTHRNQYNLNTSGTNQFIIYDPTIDPSKLPTNAYTITCFRSLPPNHAQTMLVLLILPLTPRRLQQLNMLLRMRLLHVTLSNLLHHEIRLNLHLFTQHTALNAPLARDSQHADRRLRVDEGVDAAGLIGEREFVGCL